MAERLQQKIALVFGAGSSGPGWGNGKAVAVEFAQIRFVLPKWRPARGAGAVSLSIIDIYICAHSLFH